MGSVRSASSFLRSGLFKKYYGSPLGASCRVMRQVRGCASLSDRWLIKSPFNDVEIPEISYPQYIFDAAKKNEHKTAWINGLTGQSITHGEFQTLSRRLGSALTRLGMKQGDVLGIVSPNCPEFALTFFGVASIGCINTTVNCTYTAVEIAKQLENSRASFVMTHPLLLTTIQEACNIYKGVKHIIVNGPAQAGSISLQDLIEDDGTAFPEDIKINPKEDLVVLPYSSGTTGVPKGVMLTHYNLVANLQQITHPSLMSVKGTTQDIFLGVLPFFHIYGMVPCMGLSLMTGSLTVTLPMFEPKLFVEAIQKYKVTYLHTVPPLVSFLTQSPMVKPELLDNVHTMVCGAAPVGPVLINEFRKKFTDRIQFQEGYGLTEAAPVTHLTPMNRYLPGSTGPSIPNTYAKIVDLETGKTIGPNEGTGELCIKGPQIMKGYYCNEKATKETIDEEGWLHTGDIAKMDEDENVYIVDRLKELIKVKGLQVAPAELEDLLRDHPDIIDVAVIGIPDERAGEVPRAYVVLSQNSTKTEEEIAQYVEENVAPHKKLAGGVIFVNEIPKLATGKILRRKLKETALEEMKMAS
ncbi:4-coumarate--CoA ligase 1-like isoform X1 [Penaeus chinensis]|uniref:4-coumarate--CoA ligase 1-like isoform X1 n=1 Tax=Penaeus chinensis TaxID=139456 RepID=UPI001FB848D8|nr:4-coumarate--CoA ligase 1-like isoform X1 [Penaeus chinensis]